MQLVLDRVSRTPLYRQIVDQVREQILEGTLAPGFRLPPERKLAEHLGVNRSTILAAYRELKAENMIGSHVGQGTVVLSYENEEADLSVWQEPVWGHLMSDYATRFDAGTSDLLQSLISRQDMIGLGVGIAQIHEETAVAFAELAKQAIAEDSERVLSQSPIEGFASLRETLAHTMAKRGCYCDASEVMVLSGSQQGIDLAARMLLSAGDIVVVEEPSFLLALQTFRTVGARLMGVPVDKDGMQVDVLEQLLQRYRPKLIYTIPTFQNPTGRDMSMERRKKLVELAHKYKVLILEDDAYGQLHFDQAPLPTLKSMDTAGYVIYLGTFSKILYPGLRMGWMVAHRRLIERFAGARQVIDLHTNCLSQCVVERYIASGQLDAHLQDVRKTYRARRDTMVSALEAYAPKGMTWNVPRGGYYVWCALPEGISATALLPRTAERGVVFMPGRFFYLTDRDDRHLRLNFTFAPKKDIKRGVMGICEAVEAMQKENTSRMTPAAMGTNPFD